jgi:hypothetical protein
MPWLVQVVEFWEKGLSRKDIVENRWPAERQVSFERLYYHQQNALTFQEWYNGSGGDEYPNCVPWALDPIYIDEFELIRDHQRYQQMVVMG